MSSNQNQQGSQQNRNDQSGRNTNQGNQNTGRQDLQDQNRRSNEQESQSGSRSGQESQGGHRSDQGFGSMDDDEQREIARKGGKASHDSNQGNRSGSQTGKSGNL